MLQVCYYYRGDKMADIEIRNIPSTATSPSTDDYTILDGDSNGTRKINLKGQLDAKADLTGATFTGNVSATNLSGTNTGDETEASIENKLGVDIDLATLQGNTFNGNDQLVQLNSIGQLPALDGSLLTNVETKNIIQLGTCSTASATAEKAVTLSGFVLTTGATILISCSNANTAETPTLNINSTGAKALKFKDGIAVDATPPAPINLANRKMLVTYDGTDFIIQENSKYNSGWFPVATYTAYTKTHNLGTNQIKYTIQIADDALGTNCRPSNDYYFNNYGTTEPRNYITNETTST